MCQCSEKSIQVLADLKRSCGKRRCLSPLHLHFLSFHIHTGPHQLNTATGRFRMPIRAVKGYIACLKSAQAYMIQIRYPEYKLCD
jgi:hypothetical protein